MKGIKYFHYKKQWKCWPNVMKKKKHTKFICNNIYLSLENSFRYTN